jgi:hypothetical protein
MAVSLFDDDVQLNEHEVAWKSRDMDKIQELSDSFKEKAENELFAILNDITFNKKPRNLAQSENYNKYWLDSSLSQYVDCIIAANTMNLIGSELSDQQHYNYYLNAVSKSKRFSKWAKAPEEATNVKLVLGLIKKYYSINQDDAVMYMDMMQTKGNLKDFLKIARALVTDDFLKTVTKNVKEQKQIKKQILEW